MDYPKSTPGIGLVDGRFVDENQTTGQPGSLIPAAWANALMAELLGVIKAAGIVPSEEDNAQLLRAIQTMAASDYKKSVRCATTGPIALSGLQTIDDVLLVAGDRVLVKDQATAAQNWIYTVSPNAWVRAQDANESAECAPGHLIPVQAGTANKLTVWQLTNTETPVVGTTALAFRVVIGKQGTTLADYGIGDAYRKDQTYSQAQVDALLKNVNAMPVGSILPMPKATVPAGFLELDGSVQSIATYPDLSAYLGTTYNKGDEGAGNFRLPDTRGEFLRGWDHGRGVDPGRAIGSAQKGTAVAYDDYAAVYIAGVRSGSAAADKASTFEADAATLSDYPNAVGSGVAATTTSNLIVGAARPRNLAVMWCIKAWNAPVNQGNIDIGALAVQVSQLQNMADFAVVYPAGGSKASPGNAALNSRYVEANPFPGHVVVCRAEILRNGEWGDPGFGDYTSPGGSRAACGVRATQLGGSIIVQTGVSGMTYSSAYSGDPFGSTDTVTTPVPFRVLVWKVKGVIA